MLQGVIQSSEMRPLKGAKGLHESWQNEELRYQRQSNIFDINERMKDDKQNWKGRV